MTGFIFLIISACSVVIIYSLYDYFWGYSIRKSSAEQVYRDAVHDHFSKADEWCVCWVSTGSTDRICNHCKKRRGIAFDVGRFPRFDPETGLYTAWTPNLRVLISPRGLIFTRSREYVEKSADLTLLISRYIQEEMKIQPSIALERLRNVSRISSL